MRLVVLALILLQLTACGVTVGPDNTSLARTELEKVAPWPEAGDATPASSLFSLLDSEQLRLLVDEALRANPGLLQTRLSLQIVEKESRQVRGQQLPQIDASLSGGVETDSDEHYSGSISVNWIVDLWGKLADEVSAAQMDEAEQEALLRSAQDALAADVMKSWLQLIAESHKVELQQRMIETFERNEQYILTRYRSGLGKLEDLDAARSTSASARAALAEYEETVTRLEQTLQTLLGRSSPQLIDIQADYPVVLVPLAELPAQTLAARPDLQAAYYAIASADLQATVAYKELLPEIDLYAAVQDVGSSPSSLLFHDPLWTMLGQLSASIFRGGSLRAAADAAELRAVRQYQQYRETLLTAVQEVTDGLSYERELGQRLTHIESALASARNSLAAYRQSYRTGLVDILDLLTVQKQTYELEFELDNLTYRRLVNRIDLGLALGLGV